MLQIGISEVLDLACEVCHHLVDVAVSSHMGATNKLDNCSKVTINSVAQW